MSSIIKDSTIWKDPTSQPTANEQYFRLGIIRDVIYSSEKKENVYIVEMLVRGTRVSIPCKLMTSLGGVYNYEEITLRSFKHDKSSDQNFSYETKAGDRVLVASIDGNPREGIIVGGIKHEARINKFKSEDGPQHYSVFNGIEQEVNKDGEYTITFNGIPENINILSEKPKTNKIPSPQYKKEISGTYIKFDKSGSIFIDDKSVEKPQSIVLNKSSGTITVKSGDSSISLNKNTDTIESNSKINSINASESMNVKTSKTLIDSSQEVKIKSPKVAIGTSSIELLDSIVKLIEAIGKLKIISPAGICTPIDKSPLWSKVDKIKSDIKSIKGTL